jgi:dTDP-4-amino-4,6-dideoxygalactose transaminase
MKKIKKYNIYLSPPHQSGHEMKYFEEVLTSNWLAPGGEFVGRFEDNLKTLTGRRYCVALNSGTAAIHLALHALGVIEGDYVICQAFGFVAMANPIAYLGAVPVFVDCEKDSWNMDPEMLEKAILDLGKSGIKPKAIIYAHIYGNPAKTRELISVASKYEIPLVEDAAEALGSMIDNTFTGRFGEISILSFNGNKVITTSGGGALLTDNAMLAEKAENLASQSRDTRAQFSHTEIGYNYQMSNLCGALGLAQFSCLHDWVLAKRRIFNEYREFFNQFGAFESVKDHAGYYSNRWLSVFLAPDTEERKRILNVLERNSIEARRFWKPLHLLGIYKIQKDYLSGVADELFSRGICLPSGVGLTSDDLTLIKSIIGSRD